MTDSFIVYPCGVHHDPDALQWDSASHISILIFQSSNIEKFLYLKIPLHVLTPNTRELDTTLVVALLGGSVETATHWLTECWQTEDWGHSPPLSAVLSLLSPRPHMRAWDNLRSVIRDMAKYSWRISKYQTNHIISLKRLRF